MEVSRLAWSPTGIKQAGTIHTGQERSGEESFGQVLQRYLNGVNQQLVESETLSARLAAGEVKHLHEVTIAAQKATIALQLTAQVRDKAVEAYQEIMRMQI